MKVPYSKMSIDDLLNLDNEDFNKLTAAELRKISGRLRDAGNKKIKRLEKSGIETPALREVKRSGGLFSTKGKNLNELRAEYARMRKFYQSKTSTKTGYENIQKETIAKLKEQGVEVKKENLDPFFKLYERLRKEDPSITLKSVKYETMAEISNMISDGVDYEKIILAMQEQLDDIYEATSGAFEDFNSISDFFESE